MTATRRASLALVLLAACGGKATGPRPTLTDSAPTAPANLEELRGSLVSIDIAGLPADRTAAARSVLRSEVGAQFDRNQVGSDVRAIWGLGSVADVRVDARSAQGGVALRYTVREQARIRSIDVRGAAAVPAAQWLAQMPIKAGDFLDPVRASAIRRTMIEQLRQLGFHGAKVAWSAPDAKGAGVDLAFTVEEGKLVALAAIELRGNKAVAKKALLTLLAQAGDVVGQRYWRDALERGLDAIHAHYFDLGYVNAVVGPVEEKISTDGKAMTVAIGISEGDQFRLGDLAFKGALVAPEKEYASRFGVRRGQVFSRRKIAEGMDRLRELHRSKGQPGTDIIPVTELDSAKKRIKVTIQVVGPQGPRPPAPSAAPAPAPSAAPAQPTPPASGPGQP